MPSLRDDVGGWLLAIFVLLLAGKVWSWIGEGRVDILEQQPPANPRLFHARLSASLFVSIAFSALMFRYCLATVLDDPRPGMMVIFTFEFAILTIFSSFTACRYILALLEARIVNQQTIAKIEERRTEIRAERARLEQEAAEGETPNLPREEDVDENDVDVPGWEEKRRWLFGLELATGIDTDLLGMLKHFANTGQTLSKLSSTPSSSPYLLPLSVYPCISCVMST